MSVAFRKWRPPAPITARDDGMFDIGMGENERHTLTSLFDSLHGMLGAGEDDPRTTRLFPAAYHDMPEHDAEFRRLMRPELVESARASVDLARGLLDADGPVPRERVLGFMRALNSVRLVLGTLLDVAEDDTGPDPEDPDDDLGILYGYVGWLLESVVDVLDAEG